MNASASAAVHAHGYSLVNSANRRTTAVRIDTVVDFSWSARCCKAQPYSISSNVAGAGSSKPTPGRTT